MAVFIDPNRDSKIAHSVSADGTTDKQKGSGVVEVVSEVEITPEVTMDVEVSTPEPEVIPEPVDSLFASDVEDVEDEEEATPEVVTAPETTPTV